MDNNQIFSRLDSYIEHRGGQAPFLFLWDSMELFMSQLENHLRSLCQQYGVDSQSVFTLPDTGETLKIETVKSFIARGDMQPRQSFQVFLIEQIGRMTTQAQNACLKFFEEPGQGNIILLTNTNENGILDTILSRVQTIYTSRGTQKESGAFYLSLIDNYITHNDTNLFTYFFENKLEKQEYIDFLQALIRYITTHGTHISLLDELEEDISGIMKNNLNGRYIVDRYIMEL